MNNPFWRRFPVIQSMRCIEMKNYVQLRIMDETRDATPDAIVTYFREASRRFRREAGRAYPEIPTDALAVREEKDNHDA